MREWHRRNGAGFFRGKLDLFSVSADLTESDATHCTIEDPPFRWTTLFKGPVIGYDTRTRASVVVIVPPTSPNWSPTLVAGQRYLWLGMVVADGLVVLDKQAMALDVIPVPDLTTLGKEFQDQCGTATSSATVTSDGGGLTIEYEGRTFPVNLPGNVARERELADAKACRV